jgi:hypothetical protein
MIAFGNIAGKSLQPFGRNGGIFLLKRNVQILFRLTREEADRLKKRIKKSGLSQEAYLRQLINGLIPRDLPPPDYFAMMRALYDVGAALGRIERKARGAVDAAHYDEAVQLFRQTVRDITAAVILPEKR